MLSQRAGNSNVPAVVARARVSRFKRTIKKVFSFSFHDTTSQNQNNLQCIIWDPTVVTVGSSKKRNILQYFSMVAYVAVFGRVAWGKWMGSTFFLLPLCFYLVFGRQGMIKALVRSWVRDAVPSRDGNWSDK